MTGKLKRNIGQRMLATTVNLARLSAEFPRAITTFQHKDDSFLMQLRETPPVALTSPWGLPTQRHDSKMTDGRVENDA